MQALTREELSASSHSSLYRSVQTHCCSSGRGFPNVIYGTCQSPRRENLCKVAAGPNHGNLRLICQNTEPASLPWCRARITSLHGLICTGNSTQCLAKVFMPLQPFRMLVCSCGKERMTGLKKNCTNLYIYFEPPFF